MIDYIELIKGGDKTKTLFGINNKLNSDSVSTRVTDFFDSCLKKHAFKLNINGRRVIHKLTSEVIDNCIIHSTNNELDFKQWFVSAYYLKEEDLGEVNIAIFNFGQTIYEGLYKHFHKPNLDNVELQLKNQ